MVDADVKAELEGLGGGKQDVLVSGTNIKTVNGASLLGSGDLVIEAFPVDSIFITLDATDPATTLGYGAWSAFATGRVLVGVDPGNVDIDTPGKESGRYIHIEDAISNPAYPYIAVYMWRRDS